MEQATNSTINKIPDLEVAMNEEDLAELSFEVEDYVDRISEIFEKYNIAISRLSVNYKSEACQKILSYYEEIKKTFPIVKSNIKKYAEDYRNVIRVLKSEDKKYALRLENEATTTAAKAKEIEVENTKSTFI